MLAQRVKEQRKVRGMSQEELAKISGLSLRTIQRVENGESQPTGETLKRISNALDLTLDELTNWLNNNDTFKKTIKAKNEYLHIFDNKLIISKHKEFNNSVSDYEKSVNNVFKSLIVFIVFIPIFSILSAVLYNTHPDLSFYAGGVALFFMLMAIYIMLFTSGNPVVNRGQIKNIKVQNSIFGNVIVIKHSDMGRLKRRSVIVAKDEINEIRKTFIEENLSNSKDFKTDRLWIGYEGSIVIIVVFIIPFMKIIFDNTVLKGMWVYGFIFSALSGFILFLIVKGLIKSYIWRKKKQQTANSKI